MKSASWRIDINGKQQSMPKLLSEEINEWMDVNALCKLKVKDLNSDKNKQEDEMGEEYDKFCKVGKTFLASFD